MPEVARDGFVALAALADDGGLYGLGDTVRSFVEKNFEGRCALIAWVQTRDGDSQRIDGGVGTTPVGVPSEVDADFFARPTRLVNVRKPFRQPHALFAHGWRDANEPPAVGAVMFRPKMPTVNGRRSFQDLCQLCRQARVAEFPLPSGKFIAILKIAELVFQLDELGGEEQVFGGVIRSIVRDGIVPDLL